MRLLILGGAGYIGSVLTLKALMSGYKVTIVDNLTYDQGHTQAHLYGVDGCNWRVCDVRDIAFYSDSIAWADAVVHLAAIVGAPACDKHRNLAKSVNADSVGAVIRAMSKHQRFFLPNTNSGYGTVPDGVCTEETPLKPVSWYGQTKQAAEDIALTEHPGATILRLATVFGVSPRMRLDLLVNSFVREAHYNREIKLYDGHRRRNFVHVGDVASAILRVLLDNRTCANVYNFGHDGSNMTKAALAVKVVDKIGGTVSVFDGSDPDERDYEVSSAKLAKLGITASRPVDSGIDEVGVWLKTLPGVAERLGPLLSTMNTTCDHR